MIVCPSCSNESPDEALFCGYCGNKLSSEGPKKTMFGLAAVPELKPTPSSKSSPLDLGAPKLKARDSIDEGWDIGGDDDEDLGRPTVQTPALNADTLADDFDDVDFGITAPLDETLEREEREEREAREREEREAKEAQAKRDREAKEREAKEAQEAQAKRDREAKEAQAKRDREAKEAQAKRDREAKEAQAKREAESKPKKDSKSYPAPVPGSDKEGEEEFFGTTLSQYGLAPAVDQSYISDEEIGSELKKANRSGLVMVILALLVLGLIIGAIAVFVIYGKSDG